MKGHLHWQAVVALLGFLIVAAVLTAVAFSASTTVVPAPGGSYIEGVVGTPKYINPILSQAGSVDSDISALVFNGLTKVSEGGEIVADLAERWTVSADGRTYTFYIRPGVVWHDGQPVSADDVVFTIRGMQSTDYQGPKEMAELWAGVGVEKVDAQTVRFTLESRYSPFLEYTTLGLLPAHILGAVPMKTLREHDFNATPIGTGPFQVKQASAQRVTLKANPNFHDAKPFLQEAEFRFYPNEKMVLEALRRGEIQGAGYAPTGQVQQSPRSQQTAVYTAPDVSKTVLVLFNTKSLLFADKTVRQAVALAIDRKKLIEAALGGRAEPAIGPISSASWAYEPSVQAHASDISKSRSLLEDAGWKDSDGDGLREKEGKPLGFALVTNDRPERVAVAAALARQLEGAGIKVDVQTVDWAKFVEQALALKRFDAALTEHWSPIVDPDSYQFWHSSQIKSGLNFSSWANRKVDEVLETARQTSDREERTALYRQFQSIFVEEWPAVPLYRPVYSFSVSSTVQGITLGPLREPADRFRTISQWFVRTQRSIR